MRELLTLTLAEWSTVAERLRGAATAEPGLPARIAATADCLRSHGYAVAGLGLRTSHAPSVATIRDRSRCTSRAQRANRRHS